MAPRLDRAYHLDFRFPHSADSVTFRFTASLNNDGTPLDGNWWLDNADVAIVPEPAPALAAGGGRAATAGYLRERRKAS